MFYIKKPRLTKDGAFFTLEFESAFLEKGTPMKKIYASWNVWALVLAVILAPGCTRERRSGAGPAYVQPEVVASTKLLATMTEDEKPDSETSSSEHSNTIAAASQNALHQIELNPYGKGVAYIARVGNQVYVVHNGRRSKPYQYIETHTLIISPDGKRAAYGAESAHGWVQVVDDKENGPFAERGRLSFSPDSKHIAYEARIGDAWYQFIDDKKNAGAISYFDKAVFSNDSSKVMYLENTEGGREFRLVISDLEFKKMTKITIGNPTLAISRDNAMIAAIQQVKGKQRAIELSFNQPNDVTNGPLYDEVMKLTFSDDGKSLAYVAKKGATSYLVLNGKEERLPDGEYPFSLVIRPDNKGAGIVVAGPEGAYLHQAFYSDGTFVNFYKECADLTYSRDGSHHAYVAIKNEKFLIIVNGIEGPFFDRVISPMFSPDGKYLVYRARQDGKRFVVVADAEGKIIKQHPRYERVFETIFTADGKSVAYGVKDGNKLIWKVEELLP